MSGFSFNLRFLTVITNAYFARAKLPSARNFSKSPKKPCALRFAVWANHFRGAGNEPASALDRARLEAQGLVQEHDPNHGTYATLGGHRHGEVATRSDGWR
jgi:hypothetical protein